MPVFRWGLAVGLLAACARSESSSGSLDLIDDTGHRTTLAAPAARVVSLVPVATELLFALGGGDRVVGRTRWCDYPAAAAAVPSVGDGIAPNVEAIVARRPDLVVSYRSASNAGAVGRLRGLGIPVLEISPDRFEDFGRNARLLARAIGRAAAGDSLIEAVEADLAAATRTRSPAPSVLVLAWSDPPIAIGGGSYLSEIVRRAGARNLFEDVERPSFPVSIEAVAARNPDLVLVAAEGDPAIAGRPEWQVVPAVRERRFLRISGSEFNRPSPRIGAAVRALAAGLASRR